MEITLLNVVLVITLLFVTFEAARIVFYTQRGIVSGKSAELASHSPQKPSGRALVIGDCGTVSVGVTDTKFSIVGRLTDDFPTLEIVNASKNSMSVRGLEKQLGHLKENKFDFIIIHIGSLDTIIFTPQMYINKLFKKIGQHTRTMDPEAVLLVSPSNVGSFPLFRFPLNHLYDWRSKKVNELLARISNQHNMYHVPLYRSLSTDELRNPVSLFTDDKVHPNDDGHGVWYNKLKEILIKIQKSHVESTR